MRKIIVSEFMSLDGVIQAPGGADEDTEGGFTQGGWTHPYWDDAIGMSFFEKLSSSDAFLLGRRTWQGHGAAFDPMPAGDPFFDAVNAIKKYVVSNTLASADLWRNSTIIRGDVIGQVRALKEQPGGDILSDGSSVLVRALLEAGLVDELHLAVYPVLLGGGKRIFPEGTRVNLRLAEARPLATGVTLMHYVRDQAA